MGTTVTAFYFLQCWNQSVAGIAGSIQSSVVPVALVLLACMFMISIYEAFAKGGGVREILIALAKCAACGLILRNWQAFFLDVSNGFAQVAVSISGQVDFITVFQSQINAINSSNQSMVSTLINLDLQALVNYLCAYATIILYYLFMVIFEVIYTCWGLILYAIGPFMIALLPSGATASFSKNYFKSVAEWSAWPILYAIMGLLSVKVRTIATSGSQTSTLSGAAAALTVQMQSVIVAAVYIIFLILIPFIAHSLIAGSFSQTTMAIRQVVMTAMTMGKAAGASGAAKGAGAASGSGGSGGSAGGGSGSGGAISSGSGSSSGSSGGAHGGTSPVPSPPPVTAA